MDKSLANSLISLEPKQFPEYVTAIESSGGVLSPLTRQVEALVWTDYSQPKELQKIISENPQLRWVQLPFAGVDAFADVLTTGPTFTCAKRSYSEPVAEHALALALALGRTIPERVRATSWGRKFADSLFDETVLIVGGGGIAEQLVALLKPFRSKVTIVRKRLEQSFDSEVRCVGIDQLISELGNAKFVFIACALTNETKFLFSKSAFQAMRNDAYLINVARGEIVNQDDLYWALTSGEIAAAATDVTYPEPLPDDSPLWQLSNLLITPHTADTKPIVTRLFAERLRENVTAWLAGKPLTGLVDKELGY